MDPEQWGDSLLFFPTLNSISGTVSGILLPGNGHFPEAPSQSFSIP